MNPVLEAPAACYDLTQRLSAEQLELLLANALLRGALDAGPAPTGPAANKAAAAATAPPVPATTPGEIRPPAGPWELLAPDPALALALNSPRGREADPDPRAAAALLRDSSQELAQRRRGWGNKPGSARKSPPERPLAWCLAELSGELQAGRLNAISAILSAYQFGRAAAQRAPGAAPNPGRDKEKTPPPA